MISSSLYASSKKASSQIYEIFDKVISDILQFSSKQIKNQPPSTEEKQQIFDMQKVPNISIQKYLKRINKQVNFTEDEILIILILIDRLGANNFLLTEHNIHKIIFGLIRVLSKFNQDYVVENKIFAQIGGISTQNLNLIELEILKLLNFSLYVEATEFKQYKQQIVQYFFQKDNSSNNSSTEIIREMSF